MNGQAFTKLLNLNNIYLLNNYCIDSSFYGPHVRKTDFRELSNKCGYRELDSVEIACEKFFDIESSEFCFMTENTVINDTNSVIAELRDEEVQGITFDYNRKIEHLPYKIYMQLPHLVKYWARSCSITQISKQNFEKLNRLRNIMLSDNKIQKISGNTFHGLESLMNVILSEYSNMFNATHQ